MKGKSKKGDIIAMENNELTLYINKAIGNIVSDVFVNTLNNPKESTFLIKYGKQAKESMKRRVKYEEKGQHIPAFLISSITNSCNLFCKGCYARSNGICNEKSQSQMLTDRQWENIFKQASELGIGFNLLAGGEPLIRKDVIQKASAFQNTVFPIFTNGTLIDDDYCDLFDKNRNLVPVLSIEGLQETTDSRRGEGIYLQLLDKMKMLQQHKILFGVSITVTKDNILEVSNINFMKQLESLGCRLVFFIEYVPIDKSTMSLAFSDIERHNLENRQQILRAEIPSILFLSFPGDEKSMGGCLAAGRGFFHINPYGEAEACPFSPYSDRNLQTSTLLEVLQSPFFKKLQKDRLVGGEHIGGCTLFEKQDTVKDILQLAKE